MEEPALGGDLQRVVVQAGVVGREVTQRPDAGVIAAEEVGRDRLIVEEVRRVRVRIDRHVVRRLGLDIVPPEVADIGHFHDRVETDIALERDVGLIVSARLERPRLDVVAVERGVEDERDARTLRRNREVAALHEPGNVGDRGVEDLSGDRNLRTAVVWVVKAATGEVVEHPGRAANRGLPVPGHVPGESEARTVRHVFQTVVFALLLAREPAHKEAVGDTAGPRHDRPGEGLRHDLTGDGILRRAICRCARLVAGDAGQTIRHEQHPGLRWVVERRVESRVVAANLVHRSRVGESDAVVQRQVRGYPPRVLGIPFAEPVHVVSIVAEVALGIRSVYAEQRVREPIPDAQRIGRTVPEVVDAVDVVRARLGLCVSLHREAELQAVAPT